MNSLNDYKIIDNDIDAWKHYPRYNWMYNTTRLLDSQNINWSPFRTDDMFVGLPIFTINEDAVEPYYQDGIDPSVFIMLNDKIFVKHDQGQNIHTEALIRKGTLKWFMHIDPDTNQFTEDIIGEVELRISAFVTLYFKKFNGVVSFQTIGNQIVAVKLYPTQDMLSQYPAEVITQLKKITPKKF